MPRSIGFFSNSASVTSSTPSIDEYGSVTVRCRTEISAMIATLKKSGESEFRMIAMSQA
jgi:hypothetical protein